MESVVPQRKEDSAVPKRKVSSVQVRKKSKSKVDKHNVKEEVCDKQSQKWVRVDGDKFQTVYALVESSEPPSPVSSCAQEEDEDDSSTAEPPDNNMRKKMLQNDDWRPASIREPKLKPSTDEEIDQNEVSSIADLRQHRHNIRVVSHKVHPMTFWELVRGVSNLCCVFCPPCPFPSQIIRNAAFHPPPKDSNYTLYDKQSGDYLKNAKVAMRCPDIGIKSQFAPKNVDQTADGKPKLRITIVETSKKNHVVTVHIRCKKSIELRLKSPNIIIFSQPNSTDLGYALYLIKPDLIEISDFLKCDLIAYDYSGFGASTGRISEDRLYANVESVYKYVIKEMKYRPDDVIVMGFSMGTAMSIHLASCKDVGGVILIAPFTSLLRAASGVPCCGRKADSEDTCCLDQFSSYDKASSIKARTLLCHGELDTLVVRDHSDILYRRLQNASEPFYSQTCHTGIFEHTTTWVRIRRFLNEEMNVMKAWNAALLNKKVEF